MNENVVLDAERNINANDIVCNRLYYQQLLSSTLLEDTETLSREFAPVADASLHTDETHNECDGLHSVVLGGFNNEVSGDASVVVGGADNQCVGNFTTTMGVNSVAKHDYSMVWNSDKGINVCTTNTNQLMLNPTNGMHFRLPMSHSVRDDHMLDGFACFCWDSDVNQVCMKTKQNNVMYKCSLPSQVQEIAIQLQVVDDDIKLNLSNPDDH